MPLTPGTRLGPYEIVAAIGAGGMGEVYRARDMKLNRDIALKVLPDSVAHDPDRLARFQREAQVLASLNHPNIAHIHGLEDSGGVRALVMELVEGEDLAQRIARGAVPINEALPIAKQIAEALEAAHEQGIIHRDLKPANIKVRPDGTVKILDFGLAKALDSSSRTAGIAGVTNSPTITSPVVMTGVGVLLGTAVYMSPEQARGRAVDKRTDVWSFGCVLYELLTGHRAFDGEDVTEILANIIKSEPAWSLLRAETPAPICGLIEECLKKDPRERIAGAAVLRYALSRPAFDAENKGATDRSTRSWSRAFMALTAVGLLGAALGAGVMWMRPRPEGGQSVPAVRTFGVDLPAVPPLGSHGFALSSNGRLLVYGFGGLFFRPLDRLDALPIRGTVGIMSEPFISPDGLWVGYYQDGQIKKIPIEGGSPSVITTAPNPYGITWSDQNTILFAQGDAIYEVPASGGTARSLIKLKEDESAHGPQLLPNGQTVLYTRRKGVVIGGDWERAQIVIQSLTAPREPVVVAEGTDGHYARSGHIVYGRNGSAFALPFDLKTLSASGEALTLISGLPNTSGGNRSGAYQFAIADDGTVAYIPNTPIPRLPVWVDRQGREEPVDVEPGEYAAARLSPDGSQIVLDDRGLADLWIYDLRRKTRTRLTNEPGSDVSPYWSPDGNYVFYGNDAGGSLKVFRRKADGTGTTEQITQGVFTQAVNAVMPNGSAVLFRQQGVDGRNAIYIVSLTGDRTPRVLLHSPADEQDAAISPDGRWLAYRSNETGRNEIYVRPFPNVDSARWQVTASGGMQPVWARNGGELFFRGLDGAVMAVTIRPSPSFSPGTPVKLFGGDYVLAANSRNYDVSADGQRFLMIKATTARKVPQIIVMSNLLQNLYHSPSRR